MKKVKDWMLCALTAIALAAATFILWRSQPTAGMTRTKAVIVDMEEREYYDHDNIHRVDYTYYIDYSAGGQDFRHVELSYSDGEYKKGDQVVIYYDPANPVEYRCDQSGAILYTGIGTAVFLAAAVVLFLRGR